MSTSTNLLSGHFVVCKNKNFFYSAKPLDHCPNHPDIKHPGNFCSVCGTQLSFDNHSVIANSNEILKAFHEETKQKYIDKISLLDPYVRDGGKQFTMYFPEHVEKKGIFEIVEISKGSFQTPVDESLMNMILALQIFLDSKNIKYKVIRGSVLQVLS